MYNKSRSYIYFWKAHWEWECGVSGLLPVPASSQQYTEAEMKLIRDYAPPESRPLLGETVAPYEAVGLYLPTKEAILCHAQTGHVSTGEEEKRFISLRHTSR